MQCLLVFCKVWVTPVYRTQHSLTVTQVDLTDLTSLLDALTGVFQVDLDAVDYERFPLFREVPYVDCLLEPGQMLFIPKGWWHYVRSLSVSFSVSFWWQ